MLNKFFFQLATPVSPIRGIVVSPTRSRRLSDSMIWGVDDSPHHWYGSRRLSISMIRGVGDSPTLRITDTASFHFKNSIAYSPYQCCVESSTPRVSDAERGRLPILLSRRVTDSAYCWYGESPTLHIVESGSRFSNTNISENSKPKSERLEM
jgi:hypothetical protein